MYSIIVIPADTNKHKEFTVPHVDRTIAIEAAKEYAQYSDVARTMVITLDKQLQPVTVFDSL